MPPQPPVPTSSAAGRPPPPPPAPFATPSNRLRVSLPLVWASPELLDLVPRDVAERHGVVPVYVRKRPKRVLYVAMSDPGNSEALQECELCAGFAVKPVVASHEELREAIARFYGGSPDALEDRTPARMPVKTVNVRPPSIEIEAVTDEVLEEILAAEALDAQSEGAASGEAQPAAPPPSPAEAEPAAGPAADESAVASEAAGPAVGEAEPEKAGPGLGLVPSPEPSAGSAQGAKMVKAEAPPRQEASGETPIVSGSRPTTVRPPGDEGEPVVLVVGAPGNFVEYCRRAAGMARVRVEACDVGSAAAVAARLSPFALIVCEDIYPFDRRAFNLLAHEARAALLVWSDDADVDDLAAMLDTFAGPRAAVARASQRPMSAAAST